MRPLLHELNDFGTYLVKLAQKSDKSIHKVAIEAGITSPPRLFYAIQRDHRRRRPTTLPAATLLKLAKAVNATQDETNRLVILGLSQQLAPELKAYLTYLEKEVAKLREETGTPAPRYSFRLRSRPPAP